MILLFALFLSQFCFSIACLAVNEKQTERLVKEGWEGTSPAARRQAERMLDCCGIVVDKSPETANHTVEKLRPLPTHCQQVCSAVPGEVLGIIKTVDTNT